ncbi:hypothetical protein SUGI_0385220, partial [Cryptomeria japonica]
MLTIAWYLNLTLVIPKLDNTSFWADPRFVQIETEDDATHSKWHDSPMELLVRILVLADDHSIIVASGVCTGWRDAICVGVQDLSLSWCKRNMSNLVLSVVPRDHALIFLLEQCNKLRHLNLCGCIRAASDRALLALAHNCCHLQSLNLGWCEMVTDVGVTGLAQCCPELRALDLCGCVLITDQSVIALVGNCHELRSLGL